MYVEFVQTISFKFPILLFPPNHCLSELLSLNAIFLIMSLRLHHCDNWFTVLPEVVISCSHGLQFPVCLMKNLLCTCIFSVSLPQNKKYIFSLLPTCQSRIMTIFNPPLHPLRSFLLYQSSKIPNPNYVVILSKVSYVCL